MALSENVKKSFTQILSQKIVDSDSAELKKAKGFYNMCIDEKKIEIEGKKPLLTLLRKIGDWPLLKGIENFNQTKSWQELVGQVNRAGFEMTFPFRMTYENDPKDPTKLALLLETFLDVRYYTLPESERATNNTVLLAKILGSTNPHLFYEVMDCLVFESQLFYVTKSSQLTEPESYYSVDELSQKYPEISLLFNYVFDSTAVQLSSSSTLILNNPNYSSRIAALLDSESTYTVHNYIIWKLLEDLIDFADLETRQETYFHLKNTHSQRNQKCVEVLINKAGFAMGSIYNQYYFDPIVKSEVTKIVEAIEKQALKFINQSTWMGEKSRINLIERLKSLKTIVGYPDKPLNTDYIQKLVKDWHFDANDSTLASYHSLLALYRRIHHNRLWMSHDEEEQISFLEYSVKSDAMYIPSTHTIHIAAGLMQPPFFSLEQPKYLNFGGVGLIAAHELTHSFDILSECIDPTCPSYLEFEKRKGCAVKVYNNYTIGRLNQKVNGTSTLDENISDLMGLEIAYRAYHDWIEVHHVSEPSLANMNYTTRQLFWINAAVTHCSFLDDDALLSTVENDEHSPPEARVNVACSNSENFARDFGCSIKSKMNPTIKCRF